MILPLWIKVRRYSQEMGSLPPPTGVGTKLLHSPEIGVLASLLGHLSSRGCFFVCVCVIDDMPFGDMTKGGILIPGF